jgi:hypothetical protein
MFVLLCRYLLLVGRDAASRRCTEAEEHIRFERISITRKPNSLAQATRTRLTAVGFPQMSSRTHNQSFAHIPYSMQCK